MDIGVKGVSATTLLTFDIFRKLGISEREAIADAMVLRSYGTDENIISAAEKRSEVFFLINGKVRAYANSHAGKEVQYEELYAGMMFGELSAIDGQPRSNDCVAVVPSLAGVMSSQSFFAVLREHPLVAKAVLLRLATLVRKHMQRVYEFSTENVGIRVRLEILRMIREGDGALENSSHRFDSVPTHADIASRISTHREAVTRELKSMEKLGLIDWKPGSYVVHDVLVFEDFALRQS